MPWTTSATHSPVDVRDAIADPAGARGGSLGRDVTGDAERLGGGSLLARALVLTEGPPIRSAVACAQLWQRSLRNRGCRRPERVSRAPLPHLIPEGAPHRGSNERRGSCLASSTSSHWSWSLLPSPLLVRRGHSRGVSVS